MTLSHPFLSAPGQSSRAFFGRNPPPLSLEWSPKQRLALDLCQDADKVLLSGGYGSGKTLVALQIFLTWLLASPAGSLGLITAFSGVTAGEVIGDALAKLGYGERFSRGASGARFDLEGRRVLLKSLSDVDSGPRIRGLNLACWYADEITLQSRSAVSEALARLRSHARPRRIWSCNPDSMDHWVARDFLSDPDLVHVNFQTADNPRLPVGYIESLGYPVGSSLYKRFVLGEWGPLEGAPFALLPVVGPSPLDSFTYCFIDPALSTGGDYTAWLFIGEGGALIGRCARKSWYDLLPAILAEAKALDVTNIVYEENSIGNALYLMLRDSPFRVEGVRAKGDKKLRILRAEGVARSGRIRLSDRSDAEFIRQTRAWTPATSDHDDCPDALALALAYLFD